LRERERETGFVTWSTLKVVHFYTGLQCEEEAQFFNRDRNNNNDNNNNDNDAMAYAMHHDKLECLKLEERQTTLAAAATTAHRTQIG
jgi:hypothetical protein